MTYFSKAVRLGRETESTDLPTFLVNLGMAKIKSGLKAEARRACQEAAGLAKKSKNPEEIKEAEICLGMVIVQFSTEISKPGTKLWSPQKLMPQVNWL